MNPGENVFDTLGLENVLEIGVVRRQLQMSQLRGSRENDQNSGEDGEELMESRLRL